jgi:hypothetical protein
MDGRLSQNTVDAFSTPHGVSGAQVYQKVRSVAGNILIPRPMHQDECTVVSSTIRSTQSAGSIRFFGRQIDYLGAARTIHPADLLGAGAAQDTLRHAKAACRPSGTGDATMFKKFTISAVLAAIVATTASAAFAAPRQSPPPTVNRPAPNTGAEWWQDKGNADDMGVAYHR